MPLRTVQEAHEETIREMYLAAEARFDEGITLFEAQKFDGAIYLMGYTAEILIKLVFCRLAPSTQLSDPVGTGLSRTRILWRSLFSGTPLDYHDLNTLSFFLEYEYQRRFQRPYRRDIETELSRRTLQIYSSWWVASRYRYTRSDRDEAESVRNDVEWLRYVHADLWR